VLITSPVWAICQSVFYTTPNCCGRASIQTHCADSKSNAWRFEYFRPKADGTCQHVKQVCGAAVLQGYVHVSCTDGQTFIGRNENQCCGGFPWAGCGPKDSAGNFFPLIFWTDTMSGGYVQAFGLDGP
jgi:hypothetical protein